MFAVAAPMTTQPAQTILLIEDEQNLLNSLSFILGSAGYETLTAATGEEGVDIARSGRPDLLLLDIGLPGIDGFEVARLLAPERAAGMCIVMLSGSDDEDDIVRAFDGIADDYVVKPVRPRVLLARLRAHLGRPQPEPEPRRVCRVGALCIDLDAREVTFGKTPLHLTRTEFDLLALLAASPGRVHRRLDIIAAVHGASCVVSERSIDFQVHGLRRKLKPTGVRIETSRGVGFKLALS